MLDALEQPKPSLLINLQKSGSFHDESTVFRSEAERCSSLKRLDQFMSDVIIPLAEQTNATVLITAMAEGCVLSASFVRVCALVRAKWGQRMPFSVIAAGLVTQLYKNTAENSTWQGVRKSSQAWGQRDAMMKKAEEGLHVSAERKF